MNRPIIGITLALDTVGWIRPSIDYSYIRREYGEQIKAAGGEPLYFDNHTDPDVAARLCDGLVISGGLDIDPASYGELIDNDGWEIEPIERIKWERELIDACDRAHVPILGICYGMQLLNIHYGGTLHQHIARDVQGVLDHGSSAGNVMHDIAFTDDFLGFAEGDISTTAHRHHQAIAKLADTFTVTAHTSDGTIEAIAGRGHYGIQWHSESDGTAPRIYGAFASLCAPQSGEVRLSDLLPEPSPEAA